MVSEEDDQEIVVETESRGRYAVVFDPLDGSSNIDCGVSIGTIFGIYKLSADECKNPTKEAVLKPGREMVAAGYCLYGSTTLLVLATKQAGAEGIGKVNGFTLDTSIGEFILTHPNIKIPARGKIYSSNEGNEKYWDAPTKAYINSVK